MVATAITPKPEIPAAMTWEEAQQAEFDGLLTMECFYIGGQGNVWYLFQGQRKTHRWQDGKQVYERIAA